MTELNQDFLMYIGNTKRVVFIVEDIPDMESIDSIRWRAVDTINQGEVLIEKADVDITIIELIEDTETYHEISFIIEPEDTDGLNARSYIHELEIKDTNDTQYISTAARGQIRLVEPIIK